MRRWSFGLVLAALAVSAACAARLPVVTDPAYPDYLFPTVPTEFEGSPAAQAHDEAWTFFQVGDVSTAEIRYRLLVDQNLEFFPARAALGWLSMARNQPEAAAENFAAAISASSGYVPALVGHGDAMLALERREAALESYEAALEADSSLTPVRRVVDELRFSIAGERLRNAREAAAAGRHEEATTAYRQLIGASPNSGFLHVELARIEQSRGNVDQAVDLARRAATLDASDPAAFLLLGELHEARGELEDALRAYEQADDAEPTDLTARHIERVRDLMRLADLPPAILDIASKPEVTRGELAALIGVRLSDLLVDAAASRPVIITDIRDHWGSQWIQTVADAGVMDVDAAYRFSPLTTMRRSELADVAGAILDVIERQTDVGPLGAAGTRSFSDMRPSHRSYAAAMRSVAAGVLDMLESDSFQPSRPATGAEAVAMADRLAALAREFP